MSRRFLSVLSALVVCLGAGLFGSLLAQPPAAEPPKTPVAKPTREHMSYSVGLDIGTNVADSQVDLDIDLVIRGLKDAMSKAKPAITNEQIQAALQEFNTLAQAKLQERLKALGAKNKAEGEAFLAKNKGEKDTHTLPSGLQVQILKSGKGATPKKTDIVRVHYKGTFIDGSVFDTSLENKEPAQFPVGEVINGWSEALLRMKVGDKWKLFVPSTLAYGEAGSPPFIGPNAMLIFEVELLEIVAPASLPPPAPK